MLDHHPPRRGSLPGVMAAVVVAVLLVSASLPRAAYADDDVLLDAMRSELSRNQDGLRVEGYGHPYFLAFQMWDTEEWEISATLGALFSDSRDRRTLLDANVRVGDYTLDNSADTDASYEVIDRYQPSSWGPLLGGALAGGAQKESPRAVAHVLWLLSDFRYKEALLSYSRVRGRRVFMAEGRAPVASFSREAPSTARGPILGLELDHAGWQNRWRGAARRLSERFDTHPEIFDSDVRFKAQSILRRLVTTEGTALRTSERYYSVHAEALARAADGMLIEHSYDRYWRRPEQAPSEEEIAAGVDQLIDEVLALRVAPVLDPYTGPAILGPRATGVFFHETVGHRLESQRQKGDEEGATFRGQVGKPVLPVFLSVVDDPTTREFEGIPLNGAYDYDEEGVPAQRASLVEKGVLRGFLMSRSPIEGFDHSNGHGRAARGQQPVSRMGNLFVIATDGVSDDTLKRRLIEEARRQGKPFGLLIRSISGGSTNTASFGYQAFKGTPRMVYKLDAKTGEETLVRGVEFVGTPLVSLNRIVATGDHYEVFNGYCGAESGFVPVSAIAPATLFEEVELQRTHRSKERPQILSAPGGEARHTP